MLVVAPVTVTVPLVQAPAASAPPPMLVVVPDNPTAPTKEGAVNAPENTPGPALGSIVMVVVPLEFFPARVALLVGDPAFWKNMTPAPGGPHCDKISLTPESVLKTETATTPVSAEPSYPVAPRLPPATAGDARTSTAEIVKRIFLIGRSLLLID